MPKQIMIMAVIDDDWSMDDLLHEANDALCKHDVVMYVEEIRVIDSNYQIPNQEDG